VRDTLIDRLIRNSLTPRVPSPEDSCVNDNVMAAYLESSLSPEEANAFEAHVANCANCQETLALALKLQAQEEMPIGEPVPAHATKRLFRISIPIPAIAALALCIGIAVVSYWFYDRSGDIATKQEIADLRAKEPPPAPQAILPEKALPTEGASAANPRVAAESRERGEEVYKRNSRNDDADASGFAQSAAPAPTPVMAPPPNPAEIPKIAVLAENEAGVPDAKKSEKDIAGRLVAESSSLESKSDRIDQQSSNIPSAALGNSESVPPKPSIAQPETASSGTVAALAKGGAQEEPAAAARTQAPFPRPHIYAAMNRIATTLYETETMESNIRFVLRSLDPKQKPAETKSMGDKVLIKSRGYWIDKLCAEKSDDPIVEIKSADPDFAAIVQKYPDIKEVLPAILYWEKKNCVLSK